jgi:Mn-dependent DtxR family transcriptional regulator
MTARDRYLRAIHIVESETDGPAGTGAVADRLGVSAPTVNEMVGKLEDDGLVVHEKYKGVSLTDAGRERAERALETFCILERFHHSVLEIEGYREEARQLEAVVDATVAERLDAIVDRRPECPDCFDPAEDRCAFLGAESGD